MKNIADFGFEPESTIFLAHGRKLTKEIFDSQNVRLKNLHGRDMEICTSRYARYESCEVNFWQVNKGDNDEK